MVYLVEIKLIVDVEDEQEAQQIACYLVYNLLPTEVEDKVIRIMCETPLMLEEEETYEVKEV